MISSGYSFPCSYDKKNMKCEPCNILSTFIPSSKDPILRGNQRQQQEQQLQSEKAEFSSLFLFRQRQLQSENVHEHNRRHRSPQMKMQTENCHVISVTCACARCKQRSFELAGLRSDPTGYWYWCAKMAGNPKPCVQL